MTGRALRRGVAVGLLGAAYVVAPHVVTAAAPVVGCVAAATAPIIPAPTSVSPPAELAPYVSPAGDFTALMPGPVTVQQPAVSYGSSVTGYLAGSYGVAHVDLGGAPVDLAGYRDDMLVGAAARLTNCVPYSQQGFNGIELSAMFDASPGTTLFSRILAVDGDIFQVYGLTTSGPDDPVLAAFFASFQLTVDGATNTTLPGVPTVTAVTLPAVSVVPTVSVAPGVVPTILPLPSLPDVSATVVAPTPVSVPPTIAGVPPTVAGAPTSVAGSATVITPAAPPAGWVTFTVPDEPASIAFPTVPVANPTMTQTADGQSVPLSVWSVDQGAIAYVLTSLPYPAGSTFSLEDGRDGSLSTVGATLDTSTPIELQGRPGLEFTGTIAEQGITSVTRLYDDGTHAYSVVVVGSGPLTPTDPSVAGFLDSFTFDEAVAK